MTIVSFRRNEIPPPSEKRMAELRALAEKPDSEIDYSEVPPMTDEELGRMITKEEFMLRKQQRQPVAL